MRPVLLILALLVTLCAGAAHAQGTAAARDSANASQQPTEEVVVRGRRLTELRAQVQKTRENAYAIFNEINTTDDFDVHCHDEKKHHSRVTQRVCRAQFEDRVSGAAAKEYMATLTWSCPAGSPGQECIFSGYGQRAADRARTVEGEVPLLHDRMDDELQRLAEQDPRFAQAILDFYEASQQYETSRRRSRERSRD